MLFEILSESTEAYDRGEKFRLFRELPSLEQYVLVSQTEMYVESFTRGSGNRWTLEALSEPGVVGELTQVLRIPLPAGQSVEVPRAAIYEEVVFTDTALATSAQ